MLDIVIMAAGKGTRMKSARPKVLHTLAGRALLQHVLQTAVGLDAQSLIVVTGHGADPVEVAMRAAFPQSPLAFVRQAPQLGTGHAVLQAAPLLSQGEAAVTLVLNGDVPLIDASSLRALVDHARSGALALLTVELDDAAGYGRIVRDVAGTQVLGIVEHKDATVAQRAIREVYTGALAAPTASLRRWLAALRDDNVQREYYLTDAVAMAVADGCPVQAVPAASPLSVQGVNSPQQLASLERSFQRQQAEALMEAGVRLADPSRIDVRGRLICAADVEIDVGCVFEGEVVLGEGVRVGPHCVVRDARIEAGAVLHPFSHVDGAKVGAGAMVGPFARLRPGAVLGPEVHVGNFVEVKNASLGRGAKANHLAYLGDASVGERVNFGAGSITANYDGANKHRTQIGDDVHVGSNCVLIAPITLGDGATVGGGSTLSNDAPAGQLTVARARQVTIAGWKRPPKKG